MSSRKERKVREGGVKEGNEIRVNRREHAGI